MTGHSRIIRSTRMKGGPEYLQTGKEEKVTEKENIESGIMCGISVRYDSMWFI